MDRMVEEGGTAAGTRAPESVDEVFERLRETGPGLPRRLRQCAEHLAANPDRVAVSTVAELAAGAQVQPSAYMRFCQELGFSGFSQMQKLFRDEYQQKWPDYTTRLSKLRDSGGDTPAALLAEFAEAGRNSIESLTHTIRPDHLEEAVRKLAAARMIHVAGVRRSFPVASYLAYAFEKMEVPVMLHSGVAGMSFREALRPGDAVLAISFAPYAAETVAIAEAARDRKLDIVAMTDVVTSPLAGLSDTNLLVSEIDVGAFRALSASFTLAMALSVAVGARRRKRPGT